jgi:CPA1 family monovalent cation:H+ antiporter
MALVDQPLTEMILSVAVAYGAFLAGDALHLSRVIAVLVAALMLQHQGQTRHWVFSETARYLLFELWEFLAFIANTALFLLMGLTWQTVGLLQHPWFVLWGVLVAVAGRAVVVYGVGLLPGRLGFQLSWPERHVLFWGGLWGAVALAAALSLPVDFPMRAQLLAMTYGVVLFTLLTQGLTIGALIRWLGLQGRGRRPVEQEQANMRSEL